MIDESVLLHDAFTLVLSVNHACNLRCSYCYTGAKVHRPMPAPIALAAVRRAVSSLRPGGRLDLGFFGGEPLLEARLIASVVRRTRRLLEGRRLRFSWGLTTNGTCTHPEAWAVLTDPDCLLSISHDGLPELHDRYRKGPDGRGTSALVERTMRRLLDAGREFNVVLVVRPETSGALAEGIRYLRSLGVSRVEPSLDLWSPWSPSDRARLRDSIAECAEIWRSGLPDFSISWFDEKLVRVAGVPVDAGSRCGFGNGQIAVAPSGNLYPCERVIGEDGRCHPLRLPGHALEGDDFLSGGPKAPEERDCATMCRCSNFVRTGSPERPDDLLLDLDRMCFEETLRVMDLRKESHA